jgi:hypothetical protein
VIVKGFKKHCISDERVDEEEDGNVGSECVSNE